MERPKNSDGKRDGDDDRHEDVADAVADTLDVRAAGLRALHGGDYMRERGRLAGGGDAHDEAAVYIHCAGKKFVAGFFVRRNGFAGEHGFVHGRLTFKHHAVHRHAVAGAERDAIADFEFGNGNFNFGFRISDFGFGEIQRLEIERLAGEIQPRGRCSLSFGERVR